MNIDRKKLVQRHNPSKNKYDPFSPFSVGNGEFAYTCDFTGMQSFLPEQPGTTPLCTMSQWGFHSYPDCPDDRDPAKSLKATIYDAGGKKVGYFTDAPGQEENFTRLRVNPHRLNLARISLNFSGLDVRAGKFPDYFGNISQTLDLWSGIIRSAFEYKSVPVNVKTVVHPDRDLVSFRISSGLMARGMLTVRISFPYGSHNSDASDWNCSDKHITEVRGGAGNNRISLTRILDNDKYYVSMKADDSGGAVIITKEHNHIFSVRTSKPLLEFSAEFSEKSGEKDPLSYAETENASAVSKQEFWTSGGAIDLSDSSDPAAEEFERRIILSRYLTAIQCSGSFPPQETGLTCNSWYGKFHLEMHYWHAAQFALWNNPALLLRSMDWYGKISETARDLARYQGYAGIRWPKMTDPQGYDSPSFIGPLLCWQQPHIIMYHCLLSGSGSENTDIKKLEPLIYDTADFMADYVQEDKSGNRFVLGPPLIPAQENHAPLDTLNPVFEVEYWRWGLHYAAGLARKNGKHVPEKWLNVLDKLSDCPTDGSCYPAHEKCTDSFGKYATDHPSMLCAFGVIPGHTINRKIMSATLDKVISSWKFETAWGWDFPVMAMTAARLGRQDDAVKLLLMDSPKNTYRNNGHNPQLPGTDLPLYLPGNGGVLLAAAMMAAGWSGSDGHAPGFPENGKWSVKFENLNKLP